MNRRQLIKSCVGLVALAHLQPSAAADGEIPYSYEVYNAALVSGKPFMLDFYAPW